MEKEDMQAVALRKAIKILESVGAKFHISYNGVEFGESLTGGGKRKFRDQYVAIREYVLPKMEAMEVGDVEILLFGDFDPKTLRTSVGNLAHRLFGAGNYIVKKGNGNVAVMKTGEK